MSFSNFIEVPLNGARTVALEIRAPGSDVPLALGRWRDVRIITSDGNITFLDRAIEEGGGSAPLRDIYFDRDGPAIQSLADGSVQAVVYDRAGQDRTVQMEPLPAMSNELEDPDYDQTGIGAAHLKPAPFRVWLPIRSQSVV